MPESTLVAAVRDRVRRADGSTPTNGLQLGQQLETAKEQSATQFICRGIDENKCNPSLYLRRTSGQRSAPAPSHQRLRGAMLWSRRSRRLRAHFQSLRQMPIAAPVNVSGGQVSRNNTNSGIGRTDGLRTLLRRTACKVRWKVAFSYTKGTMHHCLLGNITENEPRKVAGPRRRHAMVFLSSQMGHPLKNNQKNRFARHAARPATELASGAPASRLHGSRYLGLLAAAPWAPVRCTHRFAGERITASLGTPERNKAGPDVIAVGVWLSFHNPMLSQFLNLSALDRPVKGAWRGYDVAPTQDL